jgi:hypothetical protein
VLLGFEVEICNRQDRLEKTLALLLILYISDLELTVGVYFFYVSDDFCDNFDFRFLSNGNKNDVHMENLFYQTAKNNNRLLLLSVGH